jgi:hypothetical protein
MAKTKTITEPETKIILENRLDEIDLTPYEENNKIKDSEVSPPPISDEEEYLSIAREISQLHRIILLPDLTNHFQLPETFSGKKFTYFGFASIDGKYTLGNGTNKIVPLHKFFVAHLIEPPEDEKLKGNKFSDPKDHYYLWEQNRECIPEYREYLDFCRRYGFQEIKARERYQLINIIKSIPTNYMGYSKETSLILR